MIGNLELKLDLLLDQQKHRVSNNVKLSSDTMSFIENLEISMDLRLCYSRTQFISNIIEDLNELINNEGMFDDFEQSIKEVESNKDTKSDSKHLGKADQKESDISRIPGGPKSVQNFINDEFSRRVDSDKDSMISFLSLKQKAFKGFLARKSLRDKQSEQLMQEYYLKYKQDESDDDDDESR